MKLSRRSVLKLLAAAAMMPVAGAGRAERGRVLRMEVGRQRLISDAYPETEVWGFDGVVPGPELRYRQGERLRVTARNALPGTTTIHWHGLRVPNAMDGVPHLTQAPIPPGGEFAYEFPLHDAGTFWYHPHDHSSEQVARGLYGALIVEERDPIAVDRDVTWVLSDWRLNPDASQREDFGALFDRAHEGRMGNTITINGKFTLKDGVFEVRGGERIRLRLINAASARIFTLRFAGHAPQVIALDGQPVAPHHPGSGEIELGPGMRADVVLDCMQRPGSRHDVSDEFDPRVSRRLIALAYRDEAPLRASPPDTPVALAPNPLSEPDVARAERHAFLFQGGAMGTIREAMFQGRRVPLAKLAREHGLAWTINGGAIKERAHQPVLTLKRGAHCVLEMRNETAWFHPMHLHGVVFRVIARDGEPTRHREWRDTVLMAPRERVDIAFVADNPGDWMFHCHVLDHQAAGMSAVIRIA